MSDDPKYDEKRLAELRHIAERPDFRNELFAADVRRLIKMIDARDEEAKHLKRDLQDTRSRLAASMEKIDAWVWSDVDDNRLESMSDDMVVVIRGGQLRALTNAQGR